MAATMLEKHLTGLAGTLLCGVSGGADSMALLALLTALRDRGEIMLCAVHVNHGLRGAESDADEAFVRERCRMLNVPLQVFTLTPPEHAGEEWARNERYAAFAQAMASMQADALVLAHHRDDQAETVVEHLLRGSGLDGLCGMRRESQRSGMRIIRPLLNVTREEIRHYLQENGLNWREDSSNAENDYFRNRIRHELIPLLESLACGASGRLAAAAQLLQDDADVLNRLAGEWLESRNGRCFDAHALGMQPAGVMTRILRQWYCRETGLPPLSRERTDALAGVVQSAAGTAVSLPGNWRAYRGMRFVHLLDGTAEDLPQHTISGCGQYPMGDVTVAIVPGQDHFGNGCTEQEMPAALLENAEIRTRRAGDYIRPFGMNGRQSLQDYFINRRIDEPFRDRVPLVCCGSEVLFVCGVGAGSIPRWSSETVNFRIVVSGNIPWYIANEGRIF